MRCTNSRELYEDGRAIANATWAQRRRYRLMVAAICFYRSGRDVWWASH
ncbi:hypothetical protein CZ787_01520 [Halomonas citrativorans]|uniref:Mobile element protein n=1 Tax=Halomonas citrativorans TaxID=2742612 RepID=A0A1R4HPH7_9GAMM|nr:hypothetical protein CZ787_01520 [Halomonas citrativorans]